MGFLYREEKQNLLLEYNDLREEILDRDYRTWVVNAILIVGSLLAAFSPGIENFSGAIISIILVVFALVLHGTSEHVTKIGQIRIEEISKQLGLSGPTKMYQTKIAGQWWYTVRRNAAYALFVILISIYLFLIFPETIVLVVSLATGYVLIAIREGFWMNLTKK